MNPLQNPGLWREVLDEIRRDRDDVTRSRDATSDPG